MVFKIYVLSNMLKSGRYPPGPKRKPHGFGDEQAQAPGAGEPAGPLTSLIRFGRNGVDIMNPPLLVGGRGAGHLAINPKAGDVS